MWIRALIVVAALLVLAPAAQADEVRMFAVGNKHRIQDAVTHADYRNKMAALMDAGFPNRSAYVQAGVDDVASHLRPADPARPRKALVVFPEDVGLVNVLIGSRGATARSADQRARRDPVPVRAVHAAGRLLRAEVPGPARRARCCSWRSPTRSTAASTRPSATSRASTACTSPPR